MGDNIRLELQELGANSLLAAPRTMPFSLKANYFEHFHSELSSHIHTETTLPLLSETKELPFEVPPATYFENLSSSIMATIAKEEQSEQIRDTPAWSKTMPYQVPPAYFENLADQILHKVPQAPKIVTNRRIPMFKTFQLAASIAFIVFAGLGIMFVNNKPGAVVANKTPIANLSQAEIENYVENNLDDFDTDIILNGLVSSDPNLPQIDFSDEEIKAYLDEYGWN